MLVHGTENMATVYCAWGADCGGQFCLEMEGLEANVAGGRGFDEQHRVDRDRWKGKCAGVGALQHALLVLLWSSGTDRAASGLGSQARESSYIPK